MRLAAGQDRDEEPAVCLVSKWEERRSKEELAIALGVATKRAPIVLAGMLELESERVRGSPRGN